MSGHTSQWGHGRPVQASVWAVEGIGTDTGDKQGTSKSKDDVMTLFGCSKRGACKCDARWFPVMGCGMVVYSHTRDR